MNSVNKPINKILTTLLVALFCLLIAWPLLVTPFITSNTNNTLNNENRVATTWPQFSILKEGFVEYASQVNKYLEDNLAFRKHLLGFYAKLHYTVLGTGSGGKAVIGKDGWLYLSNANTLQNARGVIPLSTDDAEDWAKNARIIRDTVESYGGQFLIVIVPDKPQVYPEFLPDHIVYQRAGRRADTLSQALTNAGLDHLDLLETLQQAKQDHASPIYSKTDTHWSFVGALNAYQAIMEKLNASGLNLPIVEQLQLRIINEDEFSGDLARLINLEDVFFENLRMLLPLRDKARFNRQKELLLLGDSFVGIELPYFEYSFIETTCFHHNWGKVNLEAIKQQQADVVILQMVERGLEFSLSVDSNESKPCGERF